MKLEVRTLSQIHGEESLTVVGDLMEPLFEIASDKRVESIFKNDAIPNVSKMGKLVRIITSQHSSAAFDVLSILAVNPETGDRVTKQEYINNCNPALIFSQLMAVFSDDAMQDLFKSQSQTAELTSTGSATENTEV